MNAKDQAGRGVPPLEMKNVCRTIIGIVGGMGSYATLHFFRKILDGFPAEKEWERPRVLIDNNCVMPSRVRAILYGERKEELIDSLAESIRGMLRSRADVILLACNTSHCFLPALREKVPALDAVLVDLIRTVADYCVKSGILKLRVIASEGTIATGIYDDYCSGHGIAVNYPDDQEQAVLREFIEDVKQKRWESLPERFSEYLRGSHGDTIVLGCTELSMIYDMIGDTGRLGKHVIDPVQQAVDSIRARIMKG